MAIDIRQSHVGTHDRNKYYKGIYVDDMKLVKDAVAQGVFYSYDVAPMNVKTVTLGSAMIKQYLVTIETNDTVSDLEVDDYVLYGGDLWIVETITADDETKNKEFNSRPVFKTTIQLRR